MATYTSKVDKVIYASDITGTYTQPDFARLAMAALDQAGAEVKLQAEIERMLRDAGLFRGKLFPSRT